MSYSDDYVFSTIRWSVADLVDAMERRGIEPSEANIKTFIESTRGPRTLVDRSIEEGWEVLDIILDDLKDDGVFI